MAIGASALAAAGFGGNALAQSSSTDITPNPNVPTVTASPNTSTGPQSPDEQCDDFQSSFAAANPALYNAEAFAPKAENVSNADQAKNYVNHLFDENGPLAGKGDIESLAAFMSTIVLPAQQGAVNPADYNYKEAYIQRVQTYQTPQGREQAVKDCKIAFNTLIQEVGYEDAWLRPGAPVTMFAAVRGDQNRIESAQFRPGVVADEPLSAIVFKLRESSKGLKGATEVGLLSDGTLVLNGVRFVKEEGAKEAKAKGEAKAEAHNVKKHPKMKVHMTKGHQKHAQRVQTRGATGTNTGGSTSNRTNVGGHGQSTGTGPGPSGRVSPGHVPEKNVGPLPQGKPEAKPNGKHPTPSTGGGGGHRPPAVTTTPVPPAHRPPVTHEAPPVTTTTPPVTHEAPPVTTTTPPPAPAPTPPATTTTPLPPPPVTHEAPKPPQPVSSDPNDPFNPNVNPAQ
jgi:hypothetical protein